MARIRSVKPEFWDDRKLAKRTSRDARLLYIALWNLSDEHGRLNGDPQWIKGQAFSFDDDLDAAAIERLLKELEAVGAVMRYEADEDPYIFLPKLDRHQRLEPDKVKSRLPAPPEPGANSSERRADEPVPHADSPGNRANPPTLLYGACSREQGAGGRDARDATFLANSLLEEHLAACRHRPPRDVVGRTGQRIDAFLDEGFTLEQIRAVLDLMRVRGKGPGLLPELMNELINPANPRASPDRREQARVEQRQRQLQRAIQREGSG